jgi:fumarate reductase flavoprotein subunit
MATVELVVVGGGFAGLVTGVAASELGIGTIIVEKSEGEPSWSNSRISGGALHVAMLPADSPPEVLRERIMATGAGHVRANLVEALIADAPAALDWHRQHGIELVQASASPHHRYVLAPPAQLTAGLQWKGRGGDVALRRLLERFRSAGGTYRAATRATRLLVRHDAVHGVETDGGERIQSQAVVICDGGFQANAELVDRYFGAGTAEQIMLRGTDTGTGDGALMAEAAGAKLVNMDAFYGCLLSRDARTNQNLWPFPIVDQLAGRSMLVDESTGQRFVDEGVGGVLLTNLIAKYDRPAAAVAIFDAGTWNALGAESVPVNPNLVDHGGTMHSADNVSDLARAIGAPVEPLERSVEAWNAGQLTLPHTGQMKPIAAPPYHAVPIIPGITYTMGGILIDASARVLSHEGERPIPGLWAAGTAAGGLEGGPRATYLGGIMQSTVFGRRAAASIAESLVRGT